MLMTYSIPPLSGQRTALLRADRLLGADGAGEAPKVLTPYVVGIAIRVSAAVLGKTTELDALSKLRRELEVQREPIECPTHIPHRKLFMCKCPI